MPLIIKPLFILANIETHRPRVHYYDGLASIIAFIKKHGYNADLFQIIKPITKENFKLYIEKTKPTLVCISANSIQWAVAKRFAGWVKECGNILVVVGGLHSTICPEEVMADENIDIACIGEGEYPVLELLNRLQQQEDYSNVKNFWVRKQNGAIAKNPLRNLIANLDKLPFGDRDAFYFSRYLYQTDYTVPLMSQRGCPYNCSFCNNQVLKDIFRGCGEYIRRNSPEYLMDEIRWLVAKYPIKRFFFWDDDFLMDPKWVEAFCLQYSQEFSVPFGFMTRVDRVDPKILSLLRNSGCGWIYYGVETGEPWLRNKILNKKISDAEIINAFTLTKSAGIKPYALLMINLPFETPEMVEKTSALMQRIKPYYSSLSRYFHLPGTELYQLSKGKQASQLIELDSWEKSAVGINHSDADYRGLHELNQLLCAKANNHGYFSFAEFYLEEDDKSAPIHISMAEHWRLAVDYIPCLVFSSSNTLAYEIQLENETKMEFGIGYYLIDDQLKPDGEIRFSVSIKLDKKKRCLFEKTISLAEHENEFLWYIDETIDLKHFGSNKVVVELTILRIGLTGDIETYWINPVLTGVTHPKLPAAKE